MKRPELGHVVTVALVDSDFPGWREGLPCWVGPPSNRWEFEPDALFMWPLAPRPDADTLEANGLSSLHPFVWQEDHEVQSTGLGAYRSRLDALARHPLARPPRCVVLRDEHGDLVMAPPYGRLGDHHQHWIVPASREHAVDALVAYHSGRITAEEYLWRTWGHGPGGALARRFTEGPVTGT